MKLYRFTANSSRKKYSVKIQHGNPFGLPCSVLSKQLFLLILIFILVIVLIIFILIVVLVVFVLVILVVILLIV